METIFTSVTGATIMEDERNILLRLPGLGAAQDNALNRSFIDDDFLNVCSTFPILKYIQNPYLDYSKQYGFEALSDPVSDVGSDALSTLITRSNIQSGVVHASIERAIRDGLPQLAYDIFRSALGIFDVEHKYNFSGITVDEINLSSNEFDEAYIGFSGCLINRIILPMPDETNTNIRFNGCLIGRIEGRVSENDLDRSQFVDCESSEFTDEYNVNSEVLDTSLSLGVRVLLVSLRKVFTQGGTSRLESSLYRGLDQRSKMLVPDVIDILTRYQFIVQGGRRGKITYSGVKSKRQDALRIIQTPNAAKSPVLMEAYNLA